MILWLIFVAMALLALAFVVLPLVRRPPVDGTPLRADYDMAVYKDQLRDIERDRTRGIIDDQQAAAARLEVERRLLAAADAGEPGTAKAPALQRRSWPMAVALAMILIPGFIILFGAWKARRKAAA